MPWRLKVGTEVMFQRSVKVGPRGGMIERGAVGKIIDVDPVSGDFFVRFDKINPALLAWQNGAPIKREEISSHIREFRRVDRHIRALWELFSGEIPVPNFVGRTAIAMSALALLATVLFHGLTIPTTHANALSADSDSCKFDGNQLKTLAELP